MAFLSHDYMIAVRFDLAGFFRVQQREQGSAGHLPGYLKSRGFKERGREISERNEVRNGTSAGNFVSPADSQRNSCARVEQGCLGARERHAVVA